MSTRILQVLCIQNLFPLFSRYNIRRENLNFLVLQRSYILPQNESALMRCQFENAHFSEYFQINSLVYYFMLELTIIDALSSLYRANCKKLESVSNKKQLPNLISPKLLAKQCVSLSGLEAISRVKILTSPLWLTRYWLRVWVRSNWEATSYLQPTLITLT